MFDFPDQFDRVFTSIHIYITTLYPSIPFQLFARIRCKVGFQRKRIDRCFHLETIVQFSSYFYTNLNVTQTLSKIWMKPVSFSKKSETYLGNIALLSCLADYLHPTSKGQSNLLLYLFGLSACICRIDWQYHKQADWKKR